MKVILVKDIAKMGLAGSVIKVADGHARNYLLPQKLVILATKSNLSKIENIKKKAELEKLEIENRFKALAFKINETTLTFTRKADENDHLFGSVSENDVVNSLAEKGIEIHKSAVNIQKHLKEIGSFDVQIVFSSEITANLKINVEKE